MLPKTFKPQHGPRYRDVLAFCLEIKTPKNNHGADNRHEIAAPHRAAFLCAYTCRLETYSRPLMTVCLWGQGPTALTRHGQGSTPTNAMRLNIQ